jgi:hypothetical protein
MLCHNGKLARPEMYSTEIPNTLLSFIRVLKLLTMDIIENIIKKERNMRNRLGNSVKKLLAMAILQL